MLSIIQQAEQAAKAKLNARDCVNEEYKK